MTFLIDSPTIGILFPGEMGTALGQLLRQQGQDVVTTVAGRSAATATRASAAGLRLLPNLTTVLREADVIVSLVPPGAALSVAREVVAGWPDNPRARYFLDANAIAPRTAQAIERVLQFVPLTMIDGSVHGLAGRLSTHGTLYLSGPGAESLATLFAATLRTQVVGPEIGQASAMKMLLGGLTKGLCALAIELNDLAARSQLGSAMLDEYQHYYPHLIEMLERLLPTLPRHAVRRGEELRELQAAEASVGVAPHVASSAARVIEAFAERVASREYGSEPLVSPGSLAELLARFAAPAPVVWRDVPLVDEYRRTAPTAAKPRRSILLATVGGEAPITD